MERYSRIDAEDALMLHQALNYPNDRSDFARASQVQWWDLEYMPTGKNKGCAVVIDVITGDNRNYHERQRLYSHLRIASHVWTEDLCLDWRGYECKYYRFPVYYGTWIARKAYEYMKQRYDQYVLQDRQNDFLWEGLVIQDTTVPYELTAKQSMNKHIQTKYRFN
tara:strand:- start:1583 stop:2077 length:495 start_codon:yes stop_codon:yes gene_type:complete